MSTRKHEMIYKLKIKNIQVTKYGIWILLKIPSLCVHSTGIVIDYEATV